MKIDGFYSTSFLNNSEKCINSIKFLVVVVFVFVVVVFVGEIFMLKAELD